MRPVDDGDCVSKCHSCEVLLHVVGVAWWAASAYFSYVTHLISYRAMIVASYLMTYLRTNPPGRAGSQDGTHTQLVFRCRCRCTAGEATTAELCSML